MSWLDILSELSFNIFLGACLYFCCCSRHCEPQAEEEETRANTQSVVPSAEVRARWIESSLCSHDIEQGVASVRNLEKLLKEGRPDSNVNQDKGGTKSGDPESNHQDDSVRATDCECCICLDSYQPGETICWAKNEACNHIFHQKCALEWFVNHDACPLCRSTVIQNIETQFDPESAVPSS